MRRRLLGLALLPLAGCGSWYVLGRVGDVVPPPRPPDCRFQVLDAPPSQAFDEIGILAPKDIEYGTTAGGPVPFVESVQKQVCAAGGDAVVTEKDFYGHYVRGTVIKYR